MRQVFIKTNNFKRLISAVSRMMEAPPGSPRIGLFVGPVGLGKTQAVDRLVVDLGAAYVSAARVWTPNSMLRDILAALGERPGWGAAECLKLAAAALRERAPKSSQGHGLLVVDEGDYLARGVRPPDTPKLLDTVRDLHDRSGAPVLLVGMEELARTLGTFKQFKDRVLLVEEAQPAGVPEVLALASHACDLKLESRVAVELVRATGGNLRQLTIFLERLERMARANGGGVSFEMVAQVQSKIGQEHRRLLGRVGMRVGG